MDRLSRSVELVGQSYRALMRDKELMVLPLCSGLICLAVVAGVAFGFGLDTASVSERRPDVYVPLFLIYFVTNVVGIFFQCALVAGATERMRGGSPTLGSALGAAQQRIGQIVGWAAFAATVGVILRVIHDRAGFLGKVFTGLAGIAWSLSTFFIVPVLVLENRSITGSFRRSAGVLKDTWGEALIADTGVGLAAFAATLVLVAISALVSFLTGGGGVVVFVVGMVVLMTFFSAMHGVFVASLYRYATEGATTPFEPSALARAFRSKDTDAVTRLL